MIEPRRDALRRLQSPTVMLENALADQGVTHTGAIAAMLLAMPKASS